MKHPHRPIPDRREFLSDEGYRLAVAEWRAGQRRPTNRQLLVAVALLSR